MCADDESIFQDPYITLDAVSIVCTDTQVTATVDETKLTNLTITKISINDCAEEYYNVSGHTVTVSFDTCAQNITQSSDIITQERDFFCTII